MTPEDFIGAARVPHTLKPQSFGPWKIERVSAAASFLLMLKVGFSDYTLLRRISWATMHLGDAAQEVVMEDSIGELRKHLPIWLNARGSVLVTGLGLGCVVRGLLASQDVERITVIEIDKSILRVVGHEFIGNNRVELIHGDATKVNLRGRNFDYAWHDLWTEGNEHLQVLHARLIHRFARHCPKQGAWQMPRFVKRKLRHVGIIG